MALSEVPDFASPNEALEQYRTPPDLASKIAWRVLREEGAEVSAVIDLGCGTGILCFAFVLAGSPYCVCLDVDRDALELARGYAREKNIDLHADFVVSDVKSIAIREGVERSLAVTNPPWGTRERGADSVFLERALRISRRLVGIFPFTYTADKSYLFRAIESSGWRVIWWERAKLPLKASLPHHRKRAHLTEAVVLEAIKDDKR